MKKICVMGLCISFLAQQAGATSPVYNLKIRRVAIGGKKVNDVSSTTLSFIPLVTGHVNKWAGNQENHLYGGVIGDVRYRSHKDWFLEVTTAVARENASFCHGSLAHGKNSRTGLDDIVIESGYNFFAGKQPVKI